MRLGSGQDALAVALLPDEPEGLVATRVAGSAVMEATFRGRPGDPTVPPLACPDVIGARVLDLAPDEDRAASHLTLRTEARALEAQGLALATEALLRRATAHAALHEAVMEARAFRLAEPRAVPSFLVERLGVLLWGAGMCVSFGPAWTPLPPGADLAVGTGGRETGIFAEALLARAFRADRALASVGAGFDA